jgi:hypothetical protein
MLLATYVALWGWLISLAPRRRRRLFQGLTCTFMLFVILGILELPALLKLVHWRLLIQQATGDMQHLTWAYRPDRELGFRRRPYDRWVGRPTSDVESGWMMLPSLQEPLVFTYDQWGYRNPAGLEKAAAILIGDSYVEGAYVSDDQTVARRLQIYLERPVANLGVAGYGPMQELRVLKRDGLRYQPKTVIWFFFEGNDLYDDHGFDNTLLAAPPAQKRCALTRKDSRDITAGDSGRLALLCFVNYAVGARPFCLAMPLILDGCLNRVRRRVSSTLQTMRTYLGPTGKLDAGTRRGGHCSKRLNFAGNRVSMSFSCLFPLNFASTSPLSNSMRIALVVCGASGHCISYLMIFVVPPAHFVWI